MIGRKWAITGCFTYPCLTRNERFHFLRRVVDYWNDEHRQNRIEQECLRAFISLVPRYLHSRIVIVADRGFGKVEFPQFLKGLGVSFVIRVKGDVWVRWGGFSGCIDAVRLGKHEVVWWQGILYHKTEQERINLLLKYDPHDPWYLVTNLPNADDVVEIYAHQMRIEEGFRDFKHKDCFSLRSLGLRGVRKVEKLILVVVVAYMFVILFGAASEGVSNLFCLVSMPEHKRTGKLLSSFRIGLSLLRKVFSSWYEYRWLFNFRRVCPKDA